mmetsp:Transcript_14519/g.40051  ORF Transcript_14519/g.40051 Transcript_14519/m.40051 type:complete len:206 (-) Transcript_14519:25-642(-)|eukprot:CAMPEP_0198133278 /NCGR_PEP_ID=MMETSP1442-20131203/59481_1 /TAXON_ID= /ORGANISM="Craspedostauros australis, Strain CCMP3328" /LENGTH=205 /DNA_ID=CAMNT_0043794393 /DNA_START=1936 /DNA_END=2553 /DNA_ORIENTATION=+
MTTGVPSGLEQRTNILPIRLAQQQNQLLQSRTSPLSDTCCSHRVDTAKSFRRRRFGVEARSRCCGDADDPLVVGEMMFVSVLWPFCTAPVSTCRAVMVAAAAADDDDPLLLPLALDGSAACSSLLMVGLMQFGTSPVLSRITFANARCALFLSIRATMRVLVQRYQIVSDAEMDAVFRLDLNALQRWLHPSQLFSLVQKVWEGVP